MIQPAAPWEIKKRIDDAYEKSMNKITSEIQSRTKGIISVEEIIRVLKEMYNEKSFIEYSEQIAHRMAIQVINENAKTWRQAAQGSNLKLYRALRKNLNNNIGVRVQNQIIENAYYIRTLPHDLAQDVTTYVARETMKGRRPEAIEKEIEKMFPEHTKARAKLIARTEVSKTQSAVVEERAREYGINWYVWRPVGGERGDGRTRLSHRKMSGVLVNWNNAPSPEALIGIKSTLGRYHAGCAPNCRCYAEPVIDLDMIKWPSKIYYGGSIKRIRKLNFEKVM